MNNGTTPLQIALKILGLGGEIITTPFSYIATTSSILWENCSPVFVDIDPDFLTIDESLIEAAITDRTTCILATHVFGNACNVIRIEEIALKYNLKVIYDGAHCYGVQYNGKSIFDYGDISTCSFHATKLFHTGEGGAAFVKDLNLFNKVYYSHNFGHNGPNDFFGIGINGKLSELNAAMGLSVLPFVNDIIACRKKIINFYLNNLNFMGYRTFKLRIDLDWNYSYFPIIFENEDYLLKILEALNGCDIYPRRYFYPSLNKLHFLNSRNSCPNSELISSTILCLPLYYDLKEKDVLNIVKLINGILY
jgi:dTDP-4-amino-4,6-dideoxygalactose transaminase